MYVGMPSSHLFNTVQGGIFLQYILARRSYIDTLFPTQNKKYFSICRPTEYPMVLLMSRRYQMIYLMHMLHRVVMVWTKTSCVVSYDNFPSRHFMRQVMWVIESTNWSLFWTLPIVYYLTEIFQSDKQAESKLL